jgi:sensor c-di-GMP phosphodiesterase-like protein
VPLPGDVQGYVTDLESSIPLSSTKLTISQNNNVVDTTQTDTTGEYNFYNLDQGSYEIVVSKNTYMDLIEPVEVVTATTVTKNFELTKAPSPEYSVEYLDFGAQSTVESFTISNAGA